MDKPVSRIKQYLRQLKLKHYIGLLGVILVLLGWVLANVPRWPIVYRLVTPGYAGAITALDKMNQKGFVLEPGDRGFDEIAKIVKAYFEATVNRQVGHIRTLARGGDIVEEPDGTTWRPFLELEVAFPGEPPFKGKFYDLESRLEDAYLESRLLTWRDAIFGVGVILVGVGLFL